MPQRRVPAVLRRPQRPRRRRRHRAHRALARRQSSARRAGPRADGQGQRRLRQRVGDPRALRARPNAAVALARWLLASAHAARATELLRARGPEMAKLVLSTGGAVVHQCFVDGDRLTRGTRTAQPDRHRRSAGEPRARGDRADRQRSHPRGPAKRERHARERDAAGAPNPAARRRRSSSAQFHLRYLNPKVAADIDLERTMLIEGLAATAPARCRCDRSATSRCPRGNRRACTFRGDACGWAQARAPAT